MSGTKLVRIERCYSCGGGGKVMFSKRPCPECEGLGRVFSGDPLRISNLKEAFKKEKKQVAAEFKFGKKSRK